MDKKIKLFIGAYINQTNAQNLNARLLASHLDSSKIEVVALSLYSGNLSIPKNIKTIKCFWPHVLSKYAAYLFGIIKCDVAYLPKGECSSWLIFLIKILNKKTFTTIEGIYDKKNLEKAISFFGSKNSLLKWHSAQDENYSITAFLAKFNEKKIGLKSESKPLYLGVDGDLFEFSLKTKLSDVIMIGYNLKNKGIEDYLALADSFKDLNFHVVGDIDDYDLSKQIRVSKVKNIVMHGRLDHEALNQLLKKIDLHIFPSRSEGFPKVILETASSGVPSLIYADYGASEWMKTNYDGIIVENIDEMKLAIKNLISSKELISSLSKNARKLALDFDWKIRIKDWESVILTLAKS